MANRFGSAEAIKEAMKKYSSSGVNYFSLPNDGDTATVRFLRTDAASLDIELVHIIEVDDRKRRIKCLESDCPLCRMGRPVLKGFFFLWNHKSQQVEVWERGPGMFPDFLGLIDRYGHLNCRDYDIVRHGKKGDSKTKYQMFPGDKEPLTDDKGTEIDPEIPDMYATLVYKWTPEEMSDYLASAQGKERPRNRGQSGLNMF